MKRLGLIGRDGRTLLIGSVEALADYVETEIDV